jgi:hypothetical protein
MDSGQAEVSTNFMVNVFILFLFTDKARRKETIPWRERNLNPPLYSAWN